MLALRGSASCRSLAVVFLAVCAAACASEPAGPTTPGQCIVDEPSDGAASPCGTTESSYLTAAEHEALAQCTDIPGRVHVSDNGTIVDASWFSSLRRVGSLTFFRDDAMTSVDGLEQLSTAETLGFSQMVSLNDLGALSGLCEVTEDLYVIGVPELTSLDGLGNVGSVGGLVIIDNVALRDLDGLRGLRRVEGDVQIERNPALPTSEIEAFVETLEVGGEITIADNG